MPRSGERQRLVPVQVLGAGSEMRSGGRVVDGVWDPYVDATHGVDEAVRDGRIRPGQTVLLCALGAGITWGAAIVRM